MQSLDEKMLDSIMDKSDSPVVGIDLGTTNSVIAALVDGQVVVIEEAGTALLPSVVGMTIEGKLITGASAKNQLVAFPERTIASVKRRMGAAVRLKMADAEYSPQEISAMILRRLRDRAERALGQPVTRAVITVPAFFDENQRQATREAGEMAGFIVERIINEPTAACLVYHTHEPGRRHLLVYDLGGGTFDVSVVRMEGNVIEVLSSKGDTHLGGDDFDQLLTQMVAKRFADQHAIDLTEQASTRWRLLQACERAKCELSTLSVTRLTEEFIAEVDGIPVNLDLEIDRHEYESMIMPMIDKTIACVDAALRDARLTAAEIDELLLVGGSSRTPLVQQRLRDEFHHEPYWSVNPDLAVALGAATQAAIQAGTVVGPVLVDVTTHSIGVEAVSSEGNQRELVYFPIIHRNTPLPARHEKVFRTLHQDQRRVDVQIYQGESRHLSHNRSIGSFQLSGLNQNASSDGKILVRFDLTLDGLLRVTAIEKTTSVGTTLEIRNALSIQNDQFQAESAERLSTMFAQSDELQPQRVEFIYEADKDLATERQIRIDAAHDPLTNISLRAEKLMAQASQEDRDEIRGLLQQMRQAAEQGDEVRVCEVQAELEDLMFYISG